MYFFVRALVPRSKKESLKWLHLKFKNKLNFEDGLKFSKSFFKLKKINFWIPEFKQTYS